MKENVEVIVGGEDLDVVSEILDECSFLSAPVRGEVRPFSIPDWPLKRDVEVVVETEEELKYFTSSAPAPAPNNPSAWVVAPRNSDVPLMLHRLSGKKSIEITVHRDGTLLFRVYKTGWIHSCGRYVYSAASGSRDYVHQLNARSIFLLVSHQFLPLLEEIVEKEIDHEYGIAEAIEALAVV